MLDGRKIISDDATEHQLLCNTNINLEKLLQVIFTMYWNNVKSVYSILCTTLSHFLPNFFKEKSDGNDDSDFEILLNFKLNFLAEWL